MNTNDLIALPPEERRALIAAFWESLGEAPPSPAAQAAALESRLQSFDRQRAAAVAWDRMKAELAHRQT